MRTQNRERHCPSCGARIHGNDKYCPECGAMQRRSSQRGKYLNTSNKHGREGAVILILGVLVLVLGISTLIFFFKAQAPADISLQETTAVSDPIIMETTVGTTEEPTEQSQATTEEATESPTKFTEYIQETMPTRVPTEATKPEEMPGTVLRSAGELNVRSAAGTNYGSIGRLYGGDTVTIYEQKDVNGPRWGNIGYGWVSMDYIVFGEDYSTAPTYAQSTYWQSDYSGIWVSDDQYWCMTFLNPGDGGNIMVEHHAPECTTVWQMNGYQDEHGTIRYWNGTRTDYSNGTQTVRYTNGEGAIHLNQYTMEWHEVMEQNSGIYKTFTRTDSYRNPYLNGNNSADNQNTTNQNPPIQNDAPSVPEQITKIPKRFTASDFRNYIRNIYTEEYGSKAWIDSGYSNATVTIDSFDPYTGIYVVSIRTHSDVREKLKLEFFGGKTGDLAFIRIIEYDES